MENQPRLNLANLSYRKVLVGFLVFIVLYFVIWLLFSYSWLTIKASSDEIKTINIANENGDVVKTLDHTSGSKTIFIKRGEYKIQITAGDKFSAYKKPLQFLWFNNLDAEVEPQKSSKFLGKNPLPCIKEKPGDLLFSSCAPYGEGTIINSANRGFLPSNDSLGVDHANSTNGALLNYKDGYLSANVEENQLTLSTRETSSDQSLAIKDFDGEVNSNTVATSPDSSDFAVYSQPSKEILSFKDISTSEPLKIPIPEDRAVDDFNNKVFVSRDYVYFFSLVDYEIEDHSHVGEDEESDHEYNTDEERQQKILIYDKRTGELKADHKLSGDWQVRQVNTGPENQILLTVGVFKENIYGDFYLINDGSKPGKIDAVTDSLQTTCWKDKDNFYYLSDTGSSVYRYSLSKQASFLVYGGLSSGKFVSNIQCGSEALYVVFDHTSARQRIDPKDLGYYFHKITDEDFTGIRPESVLPIFVPTDGNVVQATLTTQGVEINVEHDLDNNPLTPSQGNAQAAVLEELSNNGVVTSGMNFVFKN
jgi:hypothetical protein